MLLCLIVFAFRMKKKYYSWEECMNLREVKVSDDDMSVTINSLLIIIPIPTVIAKIKSCEPHKTQRSYP